MLSQFLVYKVLMSFQNIYFRLVVRSPLTLPDKIVEDQIQLSRISLIRNKNYINIVRGRMRS